MEGATEQIDPLVLTLFRDIHCLTIQLNVIINIVPDNYV